MNNPQALDRNMPILVVDDLPAMRRIIRNCLKQLGFENVTEADSATGALEQVQSCEFSLVISDWQLPDFDNQGWATQVRKSATSQSIPLLVVTPEAQKAAATKSVAEARADVIVKPFTAEVLEVKIRSAVQLVK